MGVALALIIILVVVETRLLREVEHIVNHQLAGHNNLKQINSMMRKNSNDTARAIINASGILVGFAWERAFDIAVLNIAASVSVIGPAWTKLFLGIGLSLLVVPAQYRHIMRKL